MDVILYFLHTIPSSFTGKITAGVDEIWSNMNTFILFTCIIFSISLSSSYGSLMSYFVNLNSINFTPLVA
jgi:hypothetical protein